MRNLPSSKFETSRAEKQSLRARQQQDIITMFMHCPPKTIALPNPVASMIPSPG